MNKAFDANGNPASSPAAPERPWYRHLWVWFVIALPASSVVTGIFLVVVATSNADDLVQDDWYREGRGTNRSLAAENLAAEYGIGFHAGPAENDLTVFHFHASRSMVWPQTLTLALRHRTLAREDRVFLLDHLGDGRYQTPGHLPAGRWHARLGHDDVAWRLAGRASVSAGGTLQMGTMP